MRNDFRIYLLILCLALTSFFLFPLKSLAITVEECETKIRKGELDLQQAQECEGILNDLYQQATKEKKTLRTGIKRFNALIAVTTTKIYVTATQIKSLEGEIYTLSQRIGNLDVSLDKLSGILLKRIAATYKKGKIEPLTLFLSSKGFSELVSRYKYLRVVQLNDRSLIFQMETARTNYEDQKTLKEEKQQELEAAREKLEFQKTLLGQQKADKERLLQITQNKEQRYQQLLAATRAEIDAIQRIIAGKGDETEAGTVKEGSRIATIILGRSACSTGTHLHFEVREGEEVKNPLSLLKNISVIDNSDGDSSVATGSWNWPLNEPVKFNQGFGSDTSFIRSGASWYNFHTGVDISSEDRVVKATKTGTLYQGAIGCGSGTLRYVRVDHQDSNIDTYYLHVNY